MKLIALADLPNGVKAGEAFEVNDVQGQLLMRAAVARVADEPPSPSRRPPYRRRDLTAEN